MKKGTLPKPVLYLIVFITGAAVLVIEVAATRLLSPYFGMTLFNVSSVISVILAALSLGYWLGGKIADRFPKPSILFTLIFTSGMGALLTYILNIKLLPVWGEALDIMSGPLISSLVLFFLPSLFLGMVSPVAIKLSTSQVSRIGESAGNIFFFSTMGSIIGSLLAGFYLIPSFSLSGILIGTSTILIAIGIIGFLANPQSRAVLVALTVLGYTQALGIDQAKDESVIYENDSMYQRVKVKKHHFPEGEGLILKLDRSWSGAGFINSSDLPFRYTRYYKLYELVNPEADRFLYLGGGAYTTPQKLLAEREDEIEVEVVEIDPQLPQVARDFFGLKPDPRLKLAIDDARSYLKTKDKLFDMIFVDVFSMDLGVPHHLLTREFFRMVRDRLSENGSVIMNVVAGLNQDKTSLGMSALNTFREIYPNAEIIAVGSQDLEKAQNLIFWGVKNPDFKLDSNADLILNSESEEIRSLPYKRVDLSKLDFSKQIVFTDDYAPIEYLTAKMISDQLSKSKAF